MARPVRVLNVAEKPSVAKSVAGILSHGTMRTRNGRSPYNKIFEFSYTIGAQQCDMLMTSVTGHLMELDFEDQYRKWHSCDPVDLYHAPVRKKVPDDKVNLQKTLEEEARHCQWLVLWLDCDREGENIAYEVVDVCCATNPRLNIWRAHFSALIDREIHHAAQNLGRPNKMFADAVDARQEIDLRIGASFTRFQTMLLSDSFVMPFGTEERKLVLSYGPCQFPTLGFVVERYWQVQAHVPEDFWSIKCYHKSEDGSAEFAWARKRLFDELAAVIIYEMCMEEPTATVCEVTGQEKRKFPPVPLNTVELQKRASRYFRMGSEQTMKVAEELYQAGFISYPRTETDRFSENQDLQFLVNEQTQHRDWGQYALRLLDPQEELWRQPGDGGHDDKAHPPIHPTRFSQGEGNWTQDHTRIYELVVRHFLACVSQPAIGYGTTATVDIAGERFTATGLMITAKNYLDVYRFDSWGASTIPNFEVGQQFIPTRLTLEAGRTQPPPLLSEADLISLMDKAGIGTDATMHDHIKKLLDRCYATKDAQTRFCPTTLGEALVMGYDTMGKDLWKPDLRALMESDMKAVSDGRKTKAQVLDAAIQGMKSCFVDTRTQKEKLLDALGIFFERSAGGGEQRQTGEIVRLCPTCQQSNMMLRKKPDGKYMVGCSGYPNCRNVVWLPGPAFEASVTNHACPNCGPGQVFKVNLKFRRGEIPPGYNVEHTGCVFCDRVIKELIDACGSGPRPPPGGGSGTPAVPSMARAGANTRPGGGFANTNATTTGRSNSFGSRSNVGSVSAFGNGNAGGTGGNFVSARDVANANATRNCTNCGRAGHYNMDCPQHGQGQGHPPTTTHRRNVSTPAAAARGAILCECQEPAVLLTANTEANRGRRFHRCPNRACDFFQWEDDTPAAPAAPASTQRGQARGRVGGRRGQSAATRALGRSSSARAANRSGSSRQAQSSGSSRSSGSAGRRGQSNARRLNNLVSATGESIGGGGSCFNCGESGHWANACPSRNM